MTMTFGRVCALLESPERSAETLGRWGWTLPLYLDPSHLVSSHPSIPYTLEVRVLRRTLWVIHRWRWHLHDGIDSEQERRFDLFEPVLFSVEIRLDLNMGQMVCTVRERLRGQSPLLR